MILYKHRSKEREVQVGRDEPSTKSVKEKCCGMPGVDVSLVTLRE